MRFDYDTDIYWRISSYWRINPLYLTLGPRIANPKLPFKLWKNRKYWECLKKDGPDVVRYGLSNDQYYRLVDIEK